MEYYTIWIYPFLFIHLTMEGYLGCFQILIIGNKIALNIHVQMFEWMEVFNSFGYIRKSEISGSYGKSGTTSNE